MIPDATGLSKSVSHDNYKEDNKHQQVSGELDKAEESEQSQSQEEASKEVPKEQNISD